MADTSCKPPIYYEYKDNKVSDMDKIEFKYAENYKNIFRSVHGQFRI